MQTLPYIIQHTLNDVTLLSVNSHLYDIVSVMQHPPLAIGTPLGIHLVHSLYSFVCCTKYSAFSTYKTICDHCSYVHVCRNKLDGISSNITLHGMIRSRDFPAFSMPFQHLNT